MTTEKQKMSTFTDSSEGLGIDRLLAKQNDFDVAMASLLAPERNYGDNSVFLVHDGFITGFFSRIDDSESMERVHVSPLLAADLYSYRMLIIEALERYRSTALPIQLACRPKDYLKQKVLIENKFKKTDLLTCFYNSLEAARSRTSSKGTIGKSIELMPINKAPVKELTKTMNKCLENVKTVPPLSVERVRSIVEDETTDQEASCVAVLNSQIIGFIVCTTGGEIDVIGVSEKFRRQGIAKMLLTNSFRALRSDNVRAQILLRNRSSMELFKEILVKYEIEYFIYNYRP